MWGVKIHVTAKEINPETDRDRKRKSKEEAGDGINMPMRR
jgi:hypothetical protein